ncbi:ATP-dependent helicase HrpB [Streptomyces alkaliterrae]|uniref:ATP-dependent helicase HrpB n=1 Tax=Streptomyces alkaliterrae TaxID=2213162 RepID=A0A7W3WVV3_9ACTN|nr:ATP-dependent helicase HrpB [Streptomyces alkaliterrae]MBB1259185.1 ATP-dependent helicase HrpB [Streptomyces alkaliterrae]
MLRTEALHRLPVRAALPELTDALDRRGVAVLHAPPGTGKTTLVPLALAGLLDDGRPPARVLVAEPRRLAARSAAARMAWLLGERTGGSVGLTVRGERRVGASTRVEVVTTGVLLQRLQRDQELAGVDVVLVDECHERHLDADTALAFLVDVRAALRPELRLVAASATADTQSWARLLTGLEEGGPAPVVHGRGASHPVTVRHVPPPSGVRPAHGTRVDPALLRHVAATVRRAALGDDGPPGADGGDVLCFLPGAGEIGRVAGMLDDLTAAGWEVLQLHGRAPAAVQDAVLAGSATRRVVLATSVAESSLTVPGVRTVVDSGLARVPRVDHARGLGSLATVRVSHAAAAQRAGRAGREAPGVALRCWDQAEESRMPRFPAPEIAVADLTAFALQAACWGDPDASSLALPDAPPAGAMAAALETLRAVGAVDSDGRATARGRALAGLGVHPRLARALLDGAEAAGGRLAAEVVALLSEEPPRSWGADVPSVLRAARRAGRDEPYAARWRREVRRLTSALEAAGRTGRGGDGSGDLPEESAAGLVVALAYPERVAALRGRDSYLMVSGTRAEHAAGGARWLAVAAADRPAGAASARVGLAAEIDEDTALRAAGALRRRESRVAFDGDRRVVVAREVDALGAVELTARPLAEPEPERVREALLAALRAEGLRLLRWPEKAVSLRRRLDFLHRELGAPWPDVSDAALLGVVADHLSGDSLAVVDTFALLTGLLPWADGTASRLDELAPERVEVPSGSRVRVDYEPVAEGGRPVLAVKLQELFGATSTPTIADGRVPLVLHLVSPAGRPAAVTSDLESFWRQGYRAVRAELRGRYPRHPWPEDPTTAEPTRRAKPRR